jgi:hypothetical protein
LADLINNLRHISGRRLGKTGGLYGANDGYTIGTSEVGPGIVIGQQLTLRRWDGGDGCRNTVVQLLELLQIRSGVRLVGGLMGRVEGDELISYERYYIVVTSFFRY